MLLKKICIGVVCIIFLTSFIACWNIEKEEFSENLTMNEKIEDFKYLYNVIKENYPYFYIEKHYDHTNWLSLKNEYIDRIKNTKTDDIFFNVLDDMLKKLNNKNTYMIKDLNSIKDYSKNSNFESFYNNILNNSAVKNRYSDYFKNNSIEPKINTDIDKEYTSNNAVTKDIVNGKIGYLNINKMIDTNSDSMNYDIKTIDSYLDKIKEYDSLVIDIRGNSGGTNTYWINFLVPRIISSPLIFETYSFYKGGNIIHSLLESYDTKNISKVKDLTKTQLPKAPDEIFNNFKYFTNNTTKIEPRNTINFDGRIYLLIDENVTNEASSFAIFANQSNFATTIGKKTTGCESNKNSVIVALPNSGFLFTFPSSLDTTKDGISILDHGTIPKYEVNDSSKNADFAKDKCIEKVLELEGLNSESTVSITNKEFKFNDTLNYIIDYNKENSNEIYILINKLLTEYNGEITEFGEKENIDYSFKKIYNESNSFSIKYKKPKKISIQSKSKSIPLKYRDKFNNVSLEVSELNISCNPTENILVVHLNGKTKGLVIEFYDPMLTKEFIKFTT